MFFLLYMLLWAWSCLRPSQCDCLARRSHFCLRERKGDVCCLYSSSLIFVLKWTIRIFESNLFVISFSDQSFIRLATRSTRCMSIFLFPYNSDLEIIAFCWFGCVLITIGLGSFVYQTIWLILITSLSLWKKVDIPKVNNGYLSKCYWWRQKIFITNTLSSRFVSILRISFRL